MNTGLIILAAGSSSRLGRPKQLLTYHGTTLIEHAIAAARSTTVTSIVVVTGANAELVNPYSDDRILTIHNEHWQEGMASSIRSGVLQLMMNDSISQILIMVCDQPHVTGELLQHLIEERAATGKGIAGCSYRDTIGTPVLFAQKYFAALLNLKGDRGAKDIVTNNQHDLATVQFDKGVIDIDTENDYNKL